MAGKRNIKYLRRLAGRRFRKEEGKFLIEGVRFVREALVSGWPVELVGYSPEVAESAPGRALLEIIGDHCIPLLRLERGLLQELAGTETPQGILALVKQPEWKIDEALRPKGVPLMVIVDGVQDPGNLGTIIRAADAAGADGVYLLKGTVDLYNPKSLRATMGSIFHLPVMQDLLPGQLLPLLTKSGIKLVIGDPYSDLPVYKVDLTIPCAVVVGSEARGSVITVPGDAGMRVCITMPGRAESLNVAMAASIILYEAVRQRSL